MIAGISASGNSVPPLLVFPRVHFKEHMINGAPQGTIGRANPSGWSNEDILHDYLKHFVAHTAASQDRKVMLILDNHESHSAENNVNFVRVNGVVLVTLYPHTTHRTQPLDVAVLGPLKDYYNPVVDDWMLNHPGETFLIYNVAAAIGQAYPQAFTMQNIIYSFRCTGIYPFNSQIFTPADFQKSYVTDRPDPTSSAIEPAPSEPSPLEPSVSIDPEEINMSSPPSTTSTPVPVAQSNCDQKESMISPEDVCPYPQAPPRKGSRKGRKLVTSRILTETPEKKDPQPPVAPKKIRFNEEVLEEEEICSGPNEENDFKVTAVTSIS